MGRSPCRRRVTGQTETWGSGVTPVTIADAEGPVNLLANPGFEEGMPGNLGGNGKTGGGRGWSYVFLAPETGNSYIWPESDYSIHPDWGLPEFHCGSQAIRTHSDANGHTRIYQDVEVRPSARYSASVWVRAADLRGKGFGKSEGDSAGLVLQELNSSGEVIVEHPKVEAKEAGPYRKLESAFVTGTHTVKMRFALDTVIACPYTEGHVTYDDASLVERPNQ